jgi:hypothetical protein
MQIRTCGCSSITFEAHRTAERRRTGRFDPPSHDAQLPKQEIDPKDPTLVAVRQSQALRRTHAGLRWALQRAPV